MAHEQDGVLDRTGGFTEWLEGIEIRMVSFEPSLDHHPSSRFGKSSLLAKTDEIRFIMDNLRLHCHLLK
jgi:hypothetical protein